MFEHLVLFVTQNFILCLAWVAVWVAWAVFEVRFRFWGPRVLTPHDVVQWVNQEQACVLDVRDAGAYQAGHITDALHCTEQQLLEPAFFERQGERPWVIICANGQKSGAVAIKLMRHIKSQAKVIRVGYLQGGVDAWRQDGLPLVC